MKFKVGDVTISKINGNIYIIQSISNFHYNVLFWGAIIDEQFIECNNISNQEIAMFDRSCRKYTDKEVNQLHKLMVFK